MAFLFLAGAWAFLVRGFFPMVLEKIYIDLLIGVPLLVVFLMFFYHIIKELKGKR
jgi:ABC-type amino acid transport system permease subunit